MGLLSWLISLFNPRSSRKDAQTGDEEEEEIEGTGGAWNHIGIGHAAPPGMNGLLMKSFREMTGLVRILRGFPGKA